MQKDPDQMLVEFNDSAGRLLAFLFSRFRQNVQSLNRKKDDNVFQQLQAKYLFSFKNELGNMAKAYIEKCGAANMHELSNRLNSSVNIFTNEFIQQMRSL